MGTTAKIAADKRPTFLLYLIWPILYIRYVSKTASNPINTLGIWYIDEMEFISVDRFKVCGYPTSHRYDDIKICPK